MAGNAFANSAGVFEVMCDVDAKFAKIADKDCDAVSGEVRKWFKKLTVRAPFLCQMCCPDICASLAITPGLLTLGCRKRKRRMTTRLPRSTLASSRQVRSVPVHTPRSPLTASRRHEL
jgi:hypothetical protein